MSDGRQAEVTVGRLLEDVAAGGDRLVLDVAGRTATAAGLYDGARRAAGALAALGVGQGDRVATLLDNSLDNVFVWLGANLLGAVEVPVNTAQRGEFLRHQLADSGAAVAVVEETLVGRLGEVADGLPELRALVVRSDTEARGNDAAPAVDAALHPPAAADGDGVGAAPLDVAQRLPGEIHRRRDCDTPAAVAAVPAGEPDRDGLSAAPIRVALHHWADLFAADLPAALPVVAPTDLALLVYTSGTTGPSKGCMLSHRYVTGAGGRLADMLGLDAGSVLFTPNPLFHVNAKLIAVVGTLLTGGRAAIDTRFSVSRFWGEVNRTGATIASLIGAMIPLLAQAPPSEEERANRTLRTVFGAPFTPALLDTYRERFGIRCLYSVYGLTEAAPLTSLPPDEDGPPGSAGRPDPDFEVRIVDDDDLEVPPGEVGEVVARPRRPGAMFDGYWGRPSDTLEAVRNLWFHTGDLGRFDGDGYFYFVDRKKDYLRCRGENISSFELERAFMAHAALAEVAVHAVPSALGEDDLKVTAVLRPGAALTEEELVRWCLEKVPYFAVPRYVEFRAELPKNTVQRVLKYQLRGDGVTPATWDRESSGIAVTRR